MTSHLPRRPTWDCAACEQPWPCHPARTLLVGEFAQRRYSLTAYMAGHYSHALEDLRHSLAADIPPDLHERFFAWTRIPHSG